MGRGSGPSSHSEIGSLALDRKYSSTVCFEIDVWDFETAGNLPRVLRRKHLDERGRWPCRAMWRGDPHLRYLSPPGLLEATGEP